MDSAIIIEPCHVNKYLLPTWIAEVRLGLGGSLVQTGQDLRLLLDRSCKCLLFLDWELITLCHFSVPDRIDKVKKKTHFFLR